MKEGAMTDFTLVCSGKRFPCHKLVLAAQSSVFQDMFRHSESGDEIVVEDVRPEALDKLLEFVYLERVGEH